MSSGLTPQPDEYGVLLPCTPETFADFISGLLGAPQTIERYIDDPFEVRLSDIENTFHLLQQRITQQNQASLLQFSAKIYYEDDSSVLLSSLRDLIHYNEVRPVASIGVHLSWTYLIQFANRTTPEKQQIEITFRGGVVEESPVFYRRRTYMPMGSSEIFIRISHTARSWGVDIESLLLNHLQSVIVEESRFRKFAYEHADKIASMGFFVVWAALLGGSYLTAKRIADERVEEARAVLGAPLPAKVDHILMQLADRGAGERWLEAGMFVGSLGIAVILALWTAAMLERRFPSFVLLSRVAEVDREKALRKRKRRWLLYLASVVSAVATGIAGNWLFSLAAPYF